MHTKASIAQTAADKKTAALFRSRTAVRFDSFIDILRR